MVRTIKSDVAALTDPLLQFNYDLFIPVVPGVADYNARNFKTRIMTTASPGRQIEPVEVALHGVTKETAGRSQYARTLPFELLETRDMQARNVLREWHRYTRDDASVGAFESEYATTVELFQYNDKGEEVMHTFLEKAWLESFDDSSLDGSSSATVNVSATLKYFVWRDEPQETVL